MVHQLHLFTLPSAVVLVVVASSMVQPSRALPLGGDIFVTPNAKDSDQFRDKAFDREFEKVTWVGDEPVHALQPYKNPANQDNARKEVDNFPSNIYSKYDNVQKKAKDWFDSKPLIDTIRESDKYGNEGDQFYFITKPLVDLTQKVSIFTNSVLAAPKKLFQSATKTVSEKLNDVGAGLVGLRK